MRQGGYLEEEAQIKDEKKRETSRYNKKKTYRTDEKMTKAEREREVALGAAL